MASIDPLPTHLPAPPRSVRGGPGFTIWFMRIFMLPHLLVGVYLLCQAVLIVLIVLFGTDLTGTVTKATPRTTKSGAKYELEYRYTVKGHEYTDARTAGESSYTPAPQSSGAEGALGTVQLRHLGIRDFHQSILLENHSAWRSIPGPLAICLFWNTIVSLFVAVVWVAPISRRLLVKYGEATAGTVVGRFTQSGKSTTYHVSLLFRHPQTGEFISCEMQVPTKELYDSAETGRKLTILFSPRKPKHAVAYELSGYTAH